MEFDMAAPGFERILPRETELEVIAHDLYFGEGPVWNRRTGEFFWVDIIGDTIWKRTPSGGREIVMRPSYKADGMTFDQQGRLIVAGWSWRRVWRMELDGTITTLCSQWDGKKLNTPNDIIVKSDGAIYFTDPSGASSMSRCTATTCNDISIFMAYSGSRHPERRRWQSRTCVYPNGLAFSPDESLLYMNDTRQNLIRVWDVRPTAASRTRGSFTNSQDRSRALRTG